MFSIPKDFSQFRIRHMMWITFTFACCFAVCQIDFEIGLPFLVLTSTLWLGALILAVADSIDKSPIDEKHIVLQLMNIIGAFLIGGSVMFLVCWIPFFLLFVISWLPGF